MSRSGLTELKSTAITTRPVAYSFAPFTLYALIILAAYPFYRFLVGTDGISYVSIAEHYIRGRLSEALNPYWSPLLSWLIAPLLGLGIPGMHAAQVVCIISGICVLCCLRRLSRIFGLSPEIELVTLCTAAVMTASFALLWITPDLLSAAILLYYFSLIFSFGWWRQPRAGMRCGLVGGIAYLAKAYNFYFFLANFTAVSIIIWLRKGKGERMLIARQYGQGLIVLLLICAPWIAIVSERAGRPSISTASSWNHRLVGPDSPGDPQFYRLMPPSSPHALSMWENPSPSLLPDWSPLSSANNLKHQIRLVRTNTRGLVDILSSASVLGFGALFIYVIVAISELDVLSLSVIASVAMLPAGYLLVTLRDRFTWDDRYLWAALFLVLLMGFAEIELGVRALTPLARKIGVILYALSFIAIPSWGLVRSRNIGRDLYLKSLIVRRYVPQGSRIASCGDWNAGITMAYLLQAPFYGSTGITEDQEVFRSILNPNPTPREIPKPLTPQQISTSLRQNHIDYLLVWPDCRTQPAPDVLKEPIALPAERTLKLYHLVDHTGS